MYQLLLEPTWVEQVDVLLIFAATMWWKTTNITGFFRLKKLGSKK